MIVCKTAGLRQLGEDVREADAGSRELLGIGSVRGSTTSSVLPTQAPRQTTSSRTVKAS